LSSSELDRLDPAQLKALVEKLVRTGDTKRLKGVHAQLKAAVDRKQAAERSDRWAQDPGAWVQDRLGQMVWSKQREIMESVRDHRKTAVRSCHGAGKVMWPRWWCRGGSMLTRPARPL